MKKQLGQFFTTNSSYILQGFKEHIKGKVVYDPFAGNQDLIEWATQNGCKKVVGFDWITHRADYSNFPNSLVITCVFVGEQDVNQAKVDKQDVYLRQLIHRQLLKAGILLKDPRRNVFFDSEEACAKGHQGNWAARLSK